MKLLQNKTSRCVSTIMKPLRIFQFFAVLLLFAFTIYMIAMDPVPISPLVCILLIVLSGVYVFVLAVELISHFAGSTLHIIPMAIFSLLGLIFFGVVGMFLIFYAFTLVVHIVTITLCLLTALFFLIDITMVLAFWKRRCTICKRCCNNSTAELLLHKNEEPNAPVKTAVLVKTNIMRHDVTTSLSDVRVPDELQGVAMPDHCYRKIEYPRRREYVDCPTCVPSLCNVDTAQVQTETKKVSVQEQTPIVITKETPMQTIDKCEFCQQQIQLPLVEGADVPSFLSSQWSYPAIVQFIRKGVNMPCCPGCKCSTAQMQQLEHQQQQPQELTQQRTRLQTSKVNSNPSKTLMSETTQQVANTESGNDDVTKLKTAQPITTYTVASFYGPDKKTQIVPDIAYKRKIDATKIKEDLKSISENIDRKFSEETKTKIARRLENVEETNFEHINKKRSEADAERSEEEKTIGVNEKVERSKGGGEHCARTYQEFMCAMEQGSITNLEESHTSGTLIMPLSSRMKSRTLHLKSNKVDPVKDENVYNKDGTLEKVASRTALDNQIAQKSEHPARTGSPNSTIKQQLGDACSFCRRQSLTPTSDNSIRYIVFKDKKGKYFCEFCAPLDSKKITSKLEGTDLRKLRCTNCRLSLRDRGVRINVKLKSDTCPKCGRSQRHAASPSST